MKRKNALSMLLAVTATSIFALSWQVKAAQKHTIYNSDTEGVVITLGEIPLAGITVQLSKADKAIEKPVFEFSKEETNILYRIVEAEVTGKSIEEKKNVASVIIERTLSDSFPDTIESVVFEKTRGSYQFSPVQDKRYYKVDITEETKQAIDEVIQYGTTVDALYFFNMKDIKSKSVKRWINNKLEFVIKDDSHSFYKEKK